MEEYNEKLCKRIITFSLVLCMALSVFTGVVYAADNDTIVILYENDVHCAVEGYSKLAAMKKELSLILFYTTENLWLFNNIFSITIDLTFGDL